MSFSFLIPITIIVVVAVIMQGVVQIIRAAKSGGGKALLHRLDEMESHLESVEDDLDEARNRIIVLERIITDDKGGLAREIDGLAGG